MLRCQNGERIVRVAILVIISWQDRKCWLENMMFEMENLDEFHCCHLQRKEQDPESYYLR